MSRELSIFIFDKNSLSSELMEIYLKELSEVKVVKSFADYVAGCAECATNPPDIVIVDITENQEFGLDVVSKLSQVSIPVVVTSMNTNSSTVIKAFRNGAFEFLAKPVIKSELFETLKKVSKPLKNVGFNEESKIITIFSGKGGCGKTTIAANLALELARQTSRKTALIDLNFCLGEAAGYFNLKNSFNFSKFLENLDNIKPEIIPETFNKYEGSELYILSEPYNGEMLSAIKYTRLTEFFKIIKSCFSYIVVDTPSIADEKIFKVLRLSDYILYISTSNINAMKNTRNCINMLLGNGIEKDKIKIIINRFIENDEISNDEIENEFNLSIYQKIPNNYFTVMSAINKGISVADENINSNVAESLRELAVMISDSIMMNSLKNLRDGYEY